MNSGQNDSRPGDRLDDRSGDRWPGGRRPDGRHPGARYPGGQDDERPAEGFSGAGAPGSSSPGSAGPDSQRASSEGSRDEAAGSGRGGFLNGRPAVPGPRKGRWSQAEIARLRDMYGLRDERSIARELKRSPASVRRMAESLFRSASRTGPWTAQEVKQLKRYLGATSAEVIARILGRDPDEVETKVLELGRIRQTRTRWTREETLRFKRIYGTRSDEDLGVIFGRPEEEIARHAESLCLAKDKAFVKKVEGKGATRMPRWSSAELAQLRQQYATVANIELAKQLGRSVKSVVSKAHHIGLKKDPERLREMGRQNVSLRYNGGD